MINSINMYYSLNYYSKEYDSLTDEELIGFIRLGNDQAERCLFKRYSFILKRIVSCFFIMGGSLDDLFQEAMIGLNKAANGYDNNQDCSFRRFAEVCIRRQIISAIRKANKHDYLNDKYFDDVEISLISEYEDLSGNPENVVICKEEKNQYYNMTSEILSNFEKTVFAEYSKGKSYEEISKKLNKNIKSVENALQRVRKKMQNIKSEF